MWHIVRLCEVNVQYRKMVSHNVTYSRYIAASGRVNVLSSFALSSKREVLLCLVM